MDVQGERAKAKLVLPVVESLTARGPRQVNRIAGLLNTNTLACRAIVGSAGKVFNASVDNAPGTSLLSECLAASTLQLTNKQGRCLRVVMPQARTIATSGDRSIDLVLSPAHVPQIIDVSGMTSWGPPGRSPNNTRVVVRMSELRADGTALRQNAMRVVGRLPFTVPNGAFAVIITGCQPQKVRCEVRDLSNRLMCRYTEKCVPAASAAKAAVLAAVRESNACVRPNPF